MSLVRGRRRGGAEESRRRPWYCAGVKDDAFALVSERVVSGGRVAPATVIVRGEKIAEVRAGRAKVEGMGVVDVGDLVVMPGVVDVHVHVNEPGRTEWEGFRTAGRAAVAGGVTTIVVMPLNCSPVVTGVEALMGEARAAAGACACDFGFWGGVVPGNAGELRRLWEAGVLGFKCFTVHSGIDEFPNVTRRDLEEAMPIIASLGEGRGCLLAHAEDPGVIEAARAGSGLDREPRSYAAWLGSRPPESETRAVRMLAELCGGTGCRTHIVHVSVGESLAIIAEAKKRGERFSAETCPHYLSFAAEEIGDGATEFKCAPPIREKRHREALWRGLREGILDLVASDHSPAPPEIKGLKDGNFARAWGGIAGLQVQLPAVWAGASERGATLADVAGWMCEAPARLAGIEDRKGRIAAGMDADLVVFDAERRWTVRGGELHHRHKATPYDGREVRGAVCAAFLRGKKVFSVDGSGWAAGGIDAEASGRWVKRSLA
ncbi:MAG: allantoinase AllB [Planctomycetes bacterium]|nr:allantoinase AllB [Planctomycetota bacterium]